MTTPATPSTPRTPEHAGDESDFVVVLDQAGRGPADHATHPEIALLSPDFYVTPEERYRWMRANAPVYWDDATGIWGVASYQHVMEVSKDWETFCSGKGSRPDSSVPSMINFDPPQHNLRRQIVSSGFTPRRVQEHEPFLRAKVKVLLDAVEEMLRWVTPIQNMNRTATRDTQLGGQDIKEGDRLLLLYPSANRDEAVFVDPERFDIDRAPNDHLAFGGYGRHHCLGAQLARLELRILFEELLARFPVIELADPGAAVPRRRGNFVLGIESLPIRFQAD